MPLEFLETQTAGSVGKRNSCGFPFNLKGASWYRQQYLLTVAGKFASEPRICLFIAGRSLPVML